jgi:predicted ATPase
MTVRRTPVAGDAAKQTWMDATNDDEPLARVSLQYDVELDNDSLAEIRDEWISAEPVGCVLRHFLPDRLALGINVLEEDARSITMTLTGEGPRGPQRRYFGDREVLVPPKIVDIIRDLIGRVSVVYGRELAEQLQLSPDLFGHGWISLDVVHRALRAIPPHFRTDIRRQMPGTEELERLILCTLREERKEKLTVVSFRPPTVIAEASSYLDYFFCTGVRYLGPLRDEPKSLYPLAPTADPSDVGLRGEHTAAVLELHKNRPVVYVPSAAFAEPEIKAAPITRSLEVAVMDWLRYMGVADGVQSRDRGKFGHELKVNVNGSNAPHDLTHVGVGVSQVLPILVASLLAEPDTTLVFEQPELHLHPKVQTLLGDFFLSMTVVGKQCIVETHSEYLINRLRFRAAAARGSNPWVSALKAYFVERLGEESSFRRVDINEYGAVVDWPDGFFDQSQNEAEAILRAAAAKRKMQRGN